MTYSCCCGFYVTTKTRDDGEGEFAALLERGNVLLFLNDLPLEEPSEIENDAERRGVEIDISLQMTKQRRKHGNDRSDVRIQRFSLGDFLVRDEAEERHEHAVEEKGGRMQLDKLDERRENKIDVLRSR